MVVVICWPRISGYMAACWRELAAREGIDLHVIAWATTTQSPQAPFALDVVKGIPCSLLSVEERNDRNLIAQRIIDLKPDVIVISGWFHQPYVRLAFLPALADTKFVMGMDTPWRGLIRQKFARFKIGRYIDRMDRLAVAGERSWQYAKRLKVPEAKIRRAMYGINYNQFSHLHRVRSEQPDGWPKQFLYVGRYASVKGIDAMLQAYQTYRSRVQDPWPLSCCGQGPLKDRINSVTGVQDHGFTQPGDLPDRFAQSSVFVLPSLYEPWGCVIAEASAAGMPVLCTDACGASVEVVRDYWNGRIVPTNDADEMAQAMLWFHENDHLIPEMGLRGQSLAQPYSAAAWADRWVNMLDGLN